MAVRTVPFSCVACSTVTMCVVLSEACGKSRLRSAPNAREAARPSRRQADALPAGMRHWPVAGSCWSASSTLAILRARAIRGNAPRSASMRSAPLRHRPSSTYSCLARLRTASCGLLPCLRSASCQRHEGI